MPRRSPDDEVYYSPGTPEQLMAQAELTPLEPFPGTKRGWRARCPQGHEVAPFIHDVRRGGGCKRCNWRGREWNNAEKATEVMRAALLEPLVPYPGASQPWPCRCMTCGAEVAPRYSKVRHRKIGCRYCVKRP